MSLQQTPQSRVFVELLPWADRGRENYLLSGGETLPGLRRPLSSAPAQTPSREVHVSGTAEVSASPDRAQVVVRVSSTKEAAAEAKKSVCRRLDYITQSLRQQGVQSGDPGGAEVKASACNVGDLGSIPGSGRFPGEGNGNPL